MSTYKKLKSQDSFVTTYVAKKNWYLSGSIIDLAAIGVQALYALSGSEEVAELSVGKSNFGTCDNLDSQFWGSYATKKLPNYTIFNLTSRADLTEAVSAVLEINNITDKSYQDVWGYASRGRSGWLKIETKF